MKAVSFQQYYIIPDGINWTAFTADGVLCGFVNPPVRDSAVQGWQDCITGSYGEIIPYAKWDLSLRDVKDLYDTRKMWAGKLTKEKQGKNAQIALIRRRGRK